MHRVVMRPAPTPNEPLSFERGNDFLGDVIAVSTLDTTRPAPIMRPLDRKIDRNSIPVR